MIQEFIGLWMFSYMIFAANTLNDPCNPASKMSPFHPENLRGAELVRQKLGDDDVVYSWLDIWPILCPTVTAVAGVVALSAASVALK